MCTALTLLTENHYFGRNLDLEYCYEESVTITPRNFPLVFRQKYPLENHYAMIGIAHVPSDYPLYYDATNEKGLSMAGLNFPEDASYAKADFHKDNIAPFEFIPWVLSQCATVSEALFLLKKINLIQESYSQELPLTPLHWIIADKTTAITVESDQSGLHILPNPVGVLTNSPTFDKHMTYLYHFKNLPGDWSSLSRFVRATYVKLHSKCGTSEIESIHQFFHILESVEFQRGCVPKTPDSYQFTRYTSCCNTEKGVYYYRTYNNSQISAVDLYKEDLNQSQIISYPLSKNGQIYWQNLQ